VTTSPRLDTVLVVVPVHDEERLLPGCLAALHRASDRLSALRPDLDVRAVVVLDGCTDASRDIAATSGFVLVETPPLGVGAARHTGVMALSGASVRTRRTEAIWLACTDADSEVPDHWLARHAALADAGADVVVGTVRPRLADLSADRAAAWRARHVPGTANGHVHGANLGVRLSAYRGAGGFPALAEHEDVTLVAALRRAGAVVVADAGAEVLTSARLVGRTPGGYARHLREDLVPRAETRQDQAG
jgi:glycosyltransferase involved in cell wall biosynthesis